MREECWRFGSEWECEVVLEEALVRGRAREKGGGVKVSRGRLGLELKLAREPEGTLSWVEIEDGERS